MTKNKTNSAGSAKQPYIAPSCELICISTDEGMLLVTVSTVELPTVTVGTDVNTSNGWSYGD